MGTMRAVSYNVIEHVGNAHCTIKKADKVSLFR